jgi:hypothetical protein
MSKDHVTGQSNRITLIIVGLALVSLGPCFCLPLNGLPFRLILANLDPRYVSDEVESIPFDRDSWRAGRVRHRVGMAKYLADKKLLDGKTRSELVEMLGEPDVDQPGDEGMRWRLGFYAKGLFDETLWLELTNGAEGTASGAIIGTSW